MNLKNLLKYYIFPILLEFSRNDLPRKINLIETGIVNLDISSGKGTHWVAYVKKAVVVLYFDSYGDLRLTKELVGYFLSYGRVKHIYYKYTS